MASIHRSSTLDVPLEVAWDFLERYQRSEVHVFSMAAAERQEGEFRIVTLHDGQELFERIVTTDPVNYRAVYTVPGLNGYEHHQAEMRLDVAPDGSTRLTWTTDALPAGALDGREERYDVLFGELVAAIRHRTSTEEIS